MRYEGKLVFLALILVVIFGCAAYVDVPPHHPAWRPGLEVEVSFFYDALSPYGDWLWVEPWGWVWTPWDVDPGWRPYTHGRWVYTQVGWTWASDWAWGWAPFHYGRWTYQPHYGWIWIPGRVWAPAWVAWRSGHGWIGWAPLPPEAHWRAGIGLDLGGLDLSIAIVEHGWSFVGERDFLAPRVWRHLAPLPRHGHLLRGTRDRTRYEEKEHRVAVRSLDVEEVEKVIGPVEPYKIEEVDKPPRQAEAVKGGAVRVFQPKIQEPKIEEGEPVREPEPKRPVADEGAPPQEKKPPAPEREVSRQEAKDRRALEAWEREQAKRLEETQKQERRQPPAGETPQEVQERQEKERQALRREAEREKEDQDKRRDRKAQSGSAERKPEPKPEPKPPV